MKVETTAMDHLGQGVTLTAYSSDPRAEVLYLEFHDGVTLRLKIHIAAVDLMRFAAAARELIRLEVKR